MAIGNLNKYFGDVPQICFKDADGTVHYKDEKIALDNTISNGYIYLDGPVEFETQSACVGEQLVRKPLVFAGAIPNGITEQVFNATVSALGFSNIEINKVSIDKSYIAEMEGIDISKFTCVSMIRAEFTIEQIEVYDPNCDFDLCKC